MPAAQQGVAILGIFVADLAFRAPRLPGVGETLVGSGFVMGPGGKGANQAMAAARAGAAVSFITRLGEDAFGAGARASWAAEGIRACVPPATGEPTGAAFIFVDERSGDNAIIVYPGAAGALSAADAEAARGPIEAAAVFLTQLEQPAAAARRGLEIARAAGVLTILNPAPAAELDPAIYPLCDYITPNESEAQGLTGLAVGSLDEARRAGDALLARGVGTALITLGERGALFHSREVSVLVPAFSAGPVVDTTGAGDAFNGGFASALSRGMAPLEAVRFGSAVAGLSVTRPGAAASMPTLAEVQALLARQG
ncbi:MAG TPA: ribokinase [Ideonella sp.]|nr:ribokinase [Ideonella sp.]